MKKYLCVFLVLIMLLPMGAPSASAYGKAENVIQTDGTDSFAAAVYSLFAENYSEDYFSLISISDGSVQAARDGKIISLGGEAKIENGEVFLPSGALSVISGGEQAISLFSERNENRLIPLAEVADELGLEVSVDGGCAYISRPYQTMRLIVRAFSDFDRYGAVTEVRGANGLFVLQYSSEEEAEYACERLNKTRGVEYAEPDLYITVDSADDGGSQDISAAAAEHHSWGADVIGSDKFNEYLTEKYGEAENLPEITVAVVDTGIDYSHPFFSGRIAEGGRDFCGESIPQDTQKHGSHVSGTIVDLTLPNVKILPIRVLTESKGGSVALLASGIDYAVSRSVDVINLSLGASGFSPMLENSVNRAYEANIPCVCAAGNSSVDVSSYTPANVEVSFAVSATKQTDEFATQYTGLSAGSNYGEGIDFSAPGDRIESAVLNGRYGTLSGTSQAAPHVSAAIAILKSDNRKYTVDEIYDALSLNAADLGAKGKDKYYGNGRISFSNIYISDCYISNRAKQAGIAEASLINFANERKTASAIFAAYDKRGRLIQTHVEDLNLEGGERRTIFAELSTEADAYKIFLWDRLENVKPICPSVRVLNQ